MNLIDGQHTKNNKNNISHHSSDNNIGISDNNNKQRIRSRGQQQTTIGDYKRTKSTKSTNSTTGSTTSNSSTNSTTNRQDNNPNLNIRTNNYRLANKTGLTNPNSSNRVNFSFFLILSSFLFLFCSSSTNVIYHNYTMPIGDHDDRIFLYSDEKMMMKEEHKDDDEDEEDEDDEEEDDKKE